ncbi:DUF748 domain-containing protein [Roseateles sp.]|uniref:DUF748 domain-containing protein n=1 Tax=Roseateles sp. TaxID=1971397 RepID=UPI00286C736F|nr:DUF748 domain-containing protein [Roseateles sp.]
MENSNPSPAAKRWRAWQMGWKGLVGLLAVFVLVFLASWLVLPRWLQSSGAELASNALGRSVTVRAVSFRPWSLALTLEGLRVAGATPQNDALLELERLTLKLSASSLWLGSPVVESLGLERPTLRLSRLAAGQYDIDDLLARFAKPATPQPPDAKPIALALYNITLSEGRLLLDDRPTQRRHEVSHMAIELPFLSTLAADVKVHVQPQLTGVLNGVTFAAKGRALPFADQPAARLDFKLDQLDLAPYAPYVPAGLPLALKQGRVDANLHLKFQQTSGQAPEIGLAGQLRLAQFALQTPAGAPALAWADLTLQLLDVQPLRGVVKLGTLALTKPSLVVSKDSAGHLRIAGVAQANDVGRGPAPVQASRPPWTLSLGQFDLTDGELDWQDASVKPKVSLKVQDIGLHLGALAWPLKTPSPIAIALRFSPTGGSAKVESALIKGAGSVSPDRLSLDWQWQGLELQWFGSYLQVQAPLRLGGLFSGKAGLLLEQPLQADPGQRATVSLSNLQVTGMALGGIAAREPLLRLASLGLDQLSVDLAGRKVSAGALKLSRPSLGLARAKDGRWSYQDLQPHGKTVTKASETAPPWAVQLGGLKVEQGSLRLLDAAAPAATAGLAAEQIALDLGGLSWPAQAKSMPVNLNFKFGPAKRGAAPTGQLRWRGAASLAPLAASGSLSAERLPLHLLNPYLDPAWGLHLQKAELGLRTQFDARQSPAGLSAQASGKLLLADLLLHQARELDGQYQIGEELLSWQALNLEGFKLQLKGGEPPEFSVAEVLLSDFFARVIINEQGKVNLRDVGAVDRKPAAAAGLADAADAAASSGAASSAPVGPRMSISIGQIRVDKGRLDFNDRFVRPNYSARLTELQGSLGAFSSERPEPAPLSLQGRVAGTGQLDVVGNVNPLGRPLSLDIRASATDIELAPLSPYAAKYVGYAIERGKFSTKVQYKIDPGGSLQANNQIILNQLTFGERVDSPDATKLPVLFAVALLKDKDGVIDVEVPIKGSVNEPEFTVGGVIWKVIVNLLGRALSAPFSLFSASGGNGGADLSRFEFAPGSAQALKPAALDSVAKMMVERPGLSLTIKAWADPAAEHAALQERQLEAALLTERQRELQRKQSTAATQLPEAETSLTDADRERLLKPVYQAAKLPNKPKNFIGFAKDIPAAEMRALLLSSFAVSEEQVRALALERGVMVRDALIAKGLPNSRIFLGAPSLHQAGAEPDPAWTPHAELQLGAH